MRCLKLKLVPISVLFPKSRAFCSLAGLWKGKMFFFSPPTVFRSIHTYPVLSSQVLWVLLSAKRPEEESSLRSICQKCELDQTNQIKTLNSLSKFFSPFLLFCSAEGVTFCVHHKWAGVLFKLKRPRPWKSRKTTLKHISPFRSSACVIWSKWSSFFNTS